MPLVPPKCARDIFRGKRKRRTTMFLVIRAWRSSRMIRFLVLTAVLGTATQLIHLRGAGAVENKAARQTRIIGSDRLVSVERLPEMGGEICLPESAAQPALSASLEQENLFSSQWQAASALAAPLRQQSGTSVP